MGPVVEQKDFEVVGQKDLWRRRMKVSMLCEASQGKTGMQRTHNIVRRSARAWPLMLLALTVSDAAIVWLTWAEYRVQKSARGAQSGEDAKAQ